MVAVGRVIPPCDPEVLADAGRVRAGQTQERAGEPHAVTLDDPRHPRERIQSGGPQHIHQHGFGLVVAGVGEQHACGRLPSGRIGQRTVSRVAGRGLDAVTVPRHFDRHHRDRVEPQPAASPCRRLSHLIRMLLQPMIDHDGPASDAPRRTHDAGHRRQRHRIATARAGHQHQRGIGRGGMVAVLGEARILPR